MEKRWCQRIPVSINVEIQHNGNKVGTCEVKDISLRGICLNSGPLAFYKKTPLILKFPNNGYLGGNIDKINAIVVRNAHSEVGLMFDPVEPEMINSIIKHAKGADRESAFLYRM